MTQLFEYIKMAVKNIRANKGRSILTMLGIIIGISSVIMIMAIGNGAKGTISDELNSIAGGQIYIYASQNYTAGEPVAITGERHRHDQNEDRTCQGRYPDAGRLGQRDDAERDL